jgi:ubiquinone biosynthesis protein Coq4
MNLVRALGERAGRVARRARTLWGAIRLLIDPNRLDDVFVLERGTLDAATNARVLETLRREPSSALAIVERVRLSRVDIAALGALPEGTLGRAFANFLRARGLDPGALPRLEAPDDETYVRAHLYETHDLWHVVTGFDTDVAGEVGLQAFYSAQVDGALSRWLVIGGLLNAVLKQPADWSRRVDAIVQGWRLGQSAKPLFGVRWDDKWRMPLGEVRAGLGLAA